MGLDLRMIRQPFVTVSVRERLLRLIKALMGSSNAAGF
jgi:hypothetical protein